MYKYNLHPTQNKLNGTPFVVYSVTYCLESCEVISPCYRFYILLEKVKQFVWTFTSCKITFSAKKKKKKHCVTPYSK